MGVDVWLRMHMKKTNWKRLTSRENVNKLERRKKKQQNKIKLSFVCLSEQIGNKTKTNQTNKKLDCIQCTIKVDAYFLFDRFGRTIIYIIYIYIHSVLIFINCLVKQKVRTREQFVWFKNPKQNYIDIVAFDILASTCVSVECVVRSR